MKTNPGDRVQSKETGAYGTRLENGRVRFDACHMNGKDWPAITLIRPDTQLTLADDNDPKKKDPDNG